MTWAVWLQQFAIKYLGGSYYDGDGYDDYDDILEFDPLTGEWKLVGRMKTARRDHGVSVVDYTAVAEFCEEWEVSWYISQIWIPYITYYVLT